MTEGRLPLELRFMLYLSAPTGAACKRCGIATRRLVLGSLTARELAFLAGTVLVSLPVAGIFMAVVFGLIARITIRFSRGLCLSCGCDGPAAA